MIIPSFFANLYFVYDGTGFYKTLKEGDILKPITETIQVSAKTTGTFQAEGQGFMCFSEKQFRPLIINEGSTVYYCAEKPLIVDGFEFSRGMTFKVNEVRYNAASRALSIKVEIPGYPELSKIVFPFKDTFKVLI